MSDKLDWALAAWDNMEKYLADAVAEDGEENLHETMYTLCLDGAVDAGADWESAVDIAIMHCGELPQ
jgi:hypothetical protein